MQPLGLSIQYILSIAVIDSCCSLMVTCEILVLFKAGLGTVKSFISNFIQYQLLFINKIIIIKGYRQLLAVLRIRIRDPGLGAFLTPGSGIRDEQPGSYFLELRNRFFAFLGGVKILKFFDEHSGSGMETVRIRDPGWKKVGSGIRDKHLTYPRPV